MITVWWYDKQVAFVHQQRACAMAAYLLYGPPSIAYVHMTSGVSRCAICEQFITREETV